MQPTDPQLAKAIALASNWASVSTLWLYGSRARGDHGQASDYDFAVTFEQPAASPMDAVARIEDLRSSLAQTLQAEVSLVDLNRAPTPLAASITGEGRLLLDLAPLQTGWLCQRIWSKWDDWLFHRGARESA